MGRMRRADSAKVNVGRVVLFGHMQCLEMNDVGDGEVHMDAADTE